MKKTNPSTISLSAKVPTLAFKASLACWLLFFCYKTSSLIVSSYNPLPEMDYWETVPHLEGYRHFPPKVLWEQHYEHRVVFPELVFAIDWLFLKGRALLPLILTGVLDVGVWIILICAYSSPNSRQTSVYWPALLLSGIVMAWPGVAFVLAFPFSLQFVLYAFSSTASLWALSQKRVSLAISLGVLATFSSANGLFIWPVLIIFGLSMRLLRSRLLAIGCVGFLSAAVFFTGYHGLGKIHPELVLSHPKAFLGYFVAYLGMPFGALGTAAGLTAGAISLIIMVALAILVWPTETNNAPILIVCFGICLLTLATALITTVSRLPTNDEALRGAMVIPGRYVNFSAHYWAALLLLVVWTAGQIRPKFAWACVLGFALCFLALFRTDTWVKVWMGFYAGYQYATLAIESGLETDGIDRVLNYSDGALVRKSVKELKRRRLSLYSWDRYGFLGKSLASIPDKNLVELPSQQVTAFESVEGGVRLVGWAKLKADLLVVDRLGTIVGLGRHLAGETSGVPIPVGHIHDFWVAFAGPSLNRDQVRVFLLLH